MAFDPNKICPLISGPFRKRKCLQHGCQWFISVKGKHPQTGVDMDEFGCAHAWMPILQIETSQQARQAGAAVESFRNEVLRRHNRLETSLRTIAALGAECYQRITGRDLEAVRIEEKRDNGIDSREG